MQFRNQVTRNANEIARLYGRIRETLCFRDDGPDQKAEWRDACSDFHAQYDDLAFPGGVYTARERLRAGDEQAIEYAIAFLEVRPYFFRSGYMYKDFMRVLRNCPLSVDQRKRYNQVRENYLVYRKKRRQTETH